MKKNSVGFKLSLMFAFCVLLFFFQNCGESTKFTKISESSSVTPEPGPQSEPVPQPQPIPFYGPLKVYRKAYYNFPASIYDSGIWMNTGITCIAYGLQTVSGRCTLSVDDPNFNIAASDFRVESRLDGGTQTCIFTGTASASNKSLTILVTAETQCETSPVPLPRESYTHCTENLRGIIPTSERVGCDELRSAI